MRRNYISPDYQNIAVNGTLNMIEESTFFGAKMLEIEDSILISNTDIIYYQRDNKEQIDLSVESSLPSYVYSPSDDKLANHTIVLDESQPGFQLDNNTRWIITIDLKTILTNYLLATLKKFRTFEGIRSNMTIFNDIDVAIKSYINNNILDRYKLSSITLYILNEDLRNQSLLRYNNQWTANVISEQNKFTKFQTQTEFDQSSIKIIFNQEKPSSQYRFSYYFDILFTKI